MSADRRTDSAAFFYPANNFGCRWLTRKSQVVERAPLLNIQPDLQTADRWSVGSVDWSTRESSCHGVTVTRIHPNVTSIRSVARLTCASKNTVIRLLIDAGKACAAYHDDNVRHLRAKRVQVDEIWSFT